MSILPRQVDDVRCGAELLVTLSGGQRMEIVGRWRVSSFDMIEGRAVHLIGGLIGDTVEFTTEGRYLINGKKHSRYRIGGFEPWPELDIWIPALRTLVTRGIYCVSDGELTLCIAGNNGERPTELRRDDEQLWCLIRMERIKRRTSRV